MVQFFGTTNRRPGIMEQIAEGLGPQMQMSLQQKMATLEDKRKMDYAAAEREALASSAEKQGMGKYAPYIRAGMPWAQIQKAEAEGQISNVQPQSAPQQQYNHQPMNQAPQYNQAQNMLLQPQFRQAMPEQQEMPQVDQSQGQPSEIPPTKQTAPTDGIKNLQDRYKQLKKNPVYQSAGDTRRRQMEATARAEHGEEIKDATLGIAKEKLAFAKSAPERERLALEDKRVDNLRNSTRNEDLADSVMSNSIESDDLGPLSLNNLAMVTGITGLLSPDAAAYNAAVKEMFIGGLTSIPGGRLNQWIEQQAKTMIPQISHSKAAAKAMLEVKRASTALNREDVRLHDELAQKYPNDPKAMLREKSNLLDKFASELQGRTAYNIQKIKEDAERIDDPYSFNSAKKVPANTPLTLEKAQVFIKLAGNDKKKARQLAKHYGYDIETMQHAGKK